MAGYKNNHRQGREYEFEPRGGRYSGIPKTTGYVEPIVNGGLESPGQRAFFRKISLEPIF